MGRYALLVGNSNYTAGLNPLPSAVRDVEALREVLLNPEVGGFAESDVTVLKDVEKGAIETAIYKLFADRKTDDLLLFYFSGHGVTDSRSDFYFTGLSTIKDELPPTALSSDYVHKAMNQSRSKRQVIILDCCHSGAFPKGMPMKDIGTVNVLPKLGGEGRAILTASSSTQYAFEQEGFDLSLYTHFLVEGLKTGAAAKNDNEDISVEDLYEYVRDKVKSTNDNMSPEFYPVKEGYRIVLAKAAQGDPKLKFWKEVEKVVQRSNGKISPIAKSILARRQGELKISQQEAETIISEVLLPYKEYEKKLDEYDKTLQDAIEEEFPLGEVMQAELQDYEKHLGLREEDIKAIKHKYAQQDIRLDLGNGITIDLVRIPTGKFVMGMPAAERQIALDNLLKYGLKREDAEKRLDLSTPQHEVTLPSFWMGKCVVTNSQWEAVMGTKPSEKHDVKFQGKNQPVVGISWDDCKEFCKKLSEKTKKNVRLPSEAEWEYACRAGTTTPFHFGETITPELVNYDGNYPYAGVPKGEYREKTVDVESFSPNAWGLYQMHGNVWEWCEDVWHENYQGAPTDGKPWLNGGDQSRRALRGGSWCNNAIRCRSANRHWGNLVNRSLIIGFRVVVS